MKKTGLVMCFKHKNYGSLLQSFALQQFFIDKEIPFECVDYQPSFSFKTFLSKISLLFIKSARKMKARSFKRNFVSKFLVSADLNSEFKKRWKAFDSFSKSRFCASEIIKNRKQLENKSKDYAAIVLGSDQVLHPINLGAHFYDLSWVGDETPKFAYSSSFGVSEIPKTQRKATAKYLNRFNAISCREKTGKNIVESLTGKKCLNTIDPTLLYSSSQWTEMLKLGEKSNQNDNYIFCYFLGSSSKERCFANQLKKQTGLKIISLIHLDEYIASDNAFGDEHPFNVGPADFVNLIKNATYVCTDSFHGTVFSLLFKKKVAIFERYSNKSSISANSRIHDLLESLSITYEEPNLEKFISSREYNCDAPLATIREKSISYLESIISEIRNA